MTPEERAKKVQAHCLGLGGICSGPEVIAYIAAQIAEAEREVFINEHVAGKISATLADIAYRKGFIAARAKAVKVAREFSAVNRETGQCNLAERIEAMFILRKESE